MKKAAFLICGLFLALTLFGCNNTPNDTDESVTFRLVKQTTIEKNGDETVTTFEYDAQGRLIKYEIISGDNADTVKEVEYDNHGYKNYEKGVSKSGLETEVFWTNDDDGRVIKQRLVATFAEASLSIESISEFEYTDEYGSYVQRFVSGTSKGNTVTVTKDKYGNEVTHEESGLFSAVYENKYEDNILVETTTSRTTQTGTVISKTVYESDKNGNMIKEVSYDSRGNVILTQIYEYLTVPTQSHP